MHRLVQAEHAHPSVHGSGGIGRFNTAVAVWVTRRVGTVWCAYLFALIALLGLNPDWYVYVAWLSQAFLQLVLLPIIIVGQNVISTAQDLRAEADHETLNLLHQINQRQLIILEELHNGQTAR